MIFLEHKGELREKKLMKLKVLIVHLTKSAVSIMKQIYRCEWL